MTKKAYFVTVLIMSVIIIVLFLYVILVPYSQKKNADIGVFDYNYGEQFIDLNLYDNENNMVIPDNVFKDYSIIFYLSEGCGTCINLLPHFSILNNIFTSIDCKIIWFDNIPNQLLEKYKIPINSNYSLHGENHLDAQNPIIYLLENNGAIIHKDINLSNIIEKLYMNNILDKDDIIKSSNKYLSEIVFPSKTEKTKLIYFSMVGCPDCKIADDVISSKNIQNAFEINYIYRNNTDAQDLYIDKYNIFSKIYDIKWYPSFIIKDSKWSIVGETPISELESVLINLS